MARRDPLTPPGRAAGRGGRTRDPEHGARMQRVRIGIIGLASVFLLTMLATAVYSLLGDDTPEAPAAANVAASAETNAAGAPKEPLAELGVTPGNVPPAAAGPVANGVAAVPVRPALPPPRR